VRCVNAAIVGVTEKVFEVNKFQNVQQHLLQQRYHWLVTGAAGFIGSNLV
jgi:UDP-N-acetylglucosamine 4-epimerase